ncbi:O-antigen ligase family protein [Seonamhaeicola sediminis]|uniref:O-antigen ligase family protein n=1 Tax=Seonamhaeicola sediminis TaxID=2528206 RepID=A0A562YHI3_9FLAO|nr:O-antigen ligase family protein [Seonamhaeicola sediminis]TWO33984.1 O-antigen ligase family protein [Seonamhaeicola sediminis]
MNNLLKNDVKEKSLLIIGIAVFAFPVFRNAVQSISILLFIGFSLILFCKRLKFTKQHLFGLIIVTIWVIYLCITLIYSDDFDYGFILAQRYINILVIPIIFVLFVPKLLFKKQHYFYLSFIVSNVIFIFFIYYKAITVAENTCYPEIYYENIFDKLKFLLSKPNYIIFSCYENEVQHSLFVHRVYNSMNFLFSIILLIELIIKRHFKSLLFYVFSILAFFVFFFLLYRQLSIVNIILAITLIPCYLMLSMPNRKLGFLIIGVLMVFSLIMLGLGLKENQVTKKYVIPVLNLVKKTFTGEGDANVDERYEINQASFNLIKQRPVFGHGIGDVQNKLNNYYKDHQTESNSFKLALIKNLNSHNNYSFLILSGGFVLFGLYCINIIFCLYKSFILKHWLYVTFLLIISLNLISENMYSRIHGALFYALFNALFLADILKYKK